MSLKQEAKEALTKTLEILEMLEEDGEFEMTLEELNMFIEIEKRLVD